jgi:hypothetical protein
LLESASGTTDQQTFNLEEALREYVDQLGTDPYISQHLAAFRFFIRDLLANCGADVEDADGGMTKYVTLVRQCYRWAVEHSTHVCFVSFNYDYLLERACTAVFDFRPDEFSDYTDLDSAWVLKPHGSVLWSWLRRDIESAKMLLGIGINDQSLIDASIDAGEVQDARDLNMVSTFEPVNYVSAGSAGGFRRFNHVLPALALPVIGKDHLIWPEAQDRLFRSEIPNGSFGRVALIGWRGVEEQFAPLLDRLIANSARVLIATGGGRNTEEAKAAVTDVEANLPVIHGKEMQASTTGFQQLSHTPEFKWLLEA